MRLPTLLVALLATFISIDAALACSCAPPPPPKQAMAGSTAVFSGKCVDVTIKDNQKFVTFEVMRIYKGEIGAKVVVTTAVHGATCGFGFTTKGDATYLVYCYGEKDKLATNICTRTNTLAGGQQDLKDLGEGSEPKKDEKK